jgi:voltage-gated potassium channel
MAPDPGPPTADPIAVWCDRHLAPLMFWLAGAFLVILGGVLHRLLPSDPTRIEAILILGGLAGLWPNFIVDAGLRYYLRHRAGLPLAARLRALTPALVPPLRLAATSYTGAPVIWLPKLGWRPIDHRLRTTLEHAFGVPMIVIALLILPLLALEYYVEKAQTHPHVVQLVEVGNSLVWVAFAAEFIIMASVARSLLGYCAKNWLNLAIVLLPLIEFLPLLRLTRLGRLGQLSRAGRLYRLRGLGMRAWRALLVLNLLYRLLGRHRESRLKSLREQLAVKLEEVETLREEIAALEAELAAEQPAAAPAGQAEAAPEAGRG